MEKQDLKNLLENIYHLLAEDDWWRNPQPDDAPLPPIGPPPPTPRPTLPTNPYIPTSPKPDIVPEYPWHRVPRPPCEGVADCFFRWVWTIKWVWDYRIQEWVLQGQGKDGAGGYWLPVNKPEGFEHGGTPTDIHGVPDRFHILLRGLGVAWPQSHDVEM